MIASWMIYAVVVSVVLALAGALLDRAAAPLVRQRRWIWIVAIAFAVGIPVWSALVTRAHTGVTAADARPGADRDASRAASLRAGDALAELIARAEPASLGRLDRALGIVWLGSALAALTAYLLGTWSIARRRRSWREGAIDGQPVLFAPSTGPAVIGALRPVIVVPEWAIGLSSEQRALMLEHERQHLMARDPLVLHAAAGAVVLMPWNLAAWWMIRRLRLAVELDCDARVLAVGRDVRAYGNLLLDVCARRVRSGAMLSPALFERTSSLTRRILAMYPGRSRFRAARFALGAVVAAGLALVACDVPSPEAVAPDGRNQATARLYGDVRGVAANGPAATRATVARYFPAIARGEGGPSILFIVRSAVGEVLLTETRPAPDVVNTGARTNERQPSATAGPGPRRGAAALRRTSSGGPGMIPPSIAAVGPANIATVDVSKHAAGTVAPNAVSLITITLKQGVIVRRSVSP